MDLIGGIGLYSLQNMQVRKKLKESMGGEQQTTVQQNITQSQTKSEVSAQDVFNYMANQSLSLKVDVKKTINVCKFVDNQQYERISSMMKDFETTVETGMQTFNGEFPNLNLSDNSKLKLVLNSLDKVNI